MFSCHSLVCDNKHIACNDAEILGGGWESCLAYAATGILFLIQFHSLPISAFAATNQGGTNNGFEIE